jgi:Kef-type K+ transport system membrane component KefB
LDQPYIILIGFALLIALSYVFNILSKKMKIPSVLFLIGTGIGVKYGFDFYDIGIPEESFEKLVELLGQIGLLMIVLEAAVDLKLNRAKRQIIRNSFLLALIVLLISSLCIAGAIMFLHGQPFFNSLLYAIPLSVVSSAVLIPSVHTLTQNKKEFLIYESTFSDIIGIMFFNFVVIQQNTFSLEGIISIVITIMLSLALSVALVYLFSKIKTEVKLFLMIAILLLFYAIGKYFHLSSLLMIFIFGIVLNNPRLFFINKLERTVNFPSIHRMTKDFRIITAETAFVVRTFFFVAFGMFIDLNSLLDERVLLVGSLIVIILYLIRYLNFKIFVKTDVFPEIFLAPRGLITILLFFQIPLAYQIDEIGRGLLLFVILATGFIMMFALLATPETKVDELTIVDIGLSPSNDHAINHPVYSEYDVLLDDEDMEGIKEPDRTVLRKKKRDPQHGKGRRKR